MDSGYFRWDPNKAEKNLEKHGISFDDAKTVFNGPYVERVDERKNYGEIRKIVLGKDNGGRALAIVITERDDHIRIISARPASIREKNLL